MKSVIRNNKEDTTITYPCLMRSRESGVIVLFINPKEGSVVFTPDDSLFEVGQYFSTFLDTADLEPFNGEVVLSND